jgi:hypothetical protein
VGKVVDSLGRLLPGWTVVAGASPTGGTSPRATTDATGAFSIAGVPPAYNVAVVSPDGSHVALFEGLTRRDLVLRDMATNPAGLRGARSAQLTGTLTGEGAYPLGALEAVVFTFNSPEVTLQRGISQNQGPHFDFPVRWTGSNSVAGRLVVLRSKSGPDGRPEPGAFAVAEARVTLQDGVATSLDLSLRPVGSTTVSVEIATPVPFPLQAITQFVQLPEGRVAPSGVELQGMVAPAFDLAAPDLAWLGGRGCVQARAGRLELLTAWQCGGLGAGRVALAMRAPPDLVDPKPEAVVAPGMAFAWTPFEGGVHELVLTPDHPGRDRPLLTVTTRSTSTRWPDLSALGVGFPEAFGTYRCIVRGAAPFADVDAAEAPGADRAPRGATASSAPITLRVAPERDPNPASLYDETDRLCGMERGKIIVCSRSVGPEGHNEWYVPSAMNMKMAHYPQFAEAIGMRCVHDCAEARAFMKAYDAYARQHPGFDANQPHDPRRPIVPPPPHAP